jgi:hypothetical protein
MTATTDQVIDEYLEQLERSLRGIPPQRRREIVAEVEEHLRAALTEIGPSPGEAEVRNALERLGDPDDIAAEARERFGGTSGRPSWTDPLAIVLLLVGGFLWLVGWIAGVTLLWLSDVWSVRDKVLGTLLVPGGLALPALLFLLGDVRSSVCVTEPQPDGIGMVTTTSCAAGAGGINVLAVVLLALLLIAPIGMAVYLGRKLRRARIAAV